MKKRFAMLLPVAALLVACGPSQISVEEAKTRMDAIMEFNQDESVRTYYEDMKIVTVDNTGEEEDTTIVYSVPNEYYSMEAAGVFQGVYDIDGVETYVVISDGTATKSTDAAQIAAFKLTVSLGALMMPVGILEIANAIVNEAAGQPTSTSSEPLVSSTFYSSGEGNLTVVAATSSREHNIEIDGNLVRSYHGKGETDEGSGDATMTITYGTSESDRPIRQ